MKIETNLKYLGFHIEYSSHDWNRLPREWFENPEIAKRVFYTGEVSMEEAFWNTPCEIVFFSTCPPE
jgi:hypothetical protein